MKPFSQHTNFFSSLKQVEKRLKLDDKSPPPPPPPLSPPSEINNTSTESLSTPIYLNFDQSINPTSSTLSDSGPPQEFISQFALTQQQQAPSQINAPDHGDDIQRLIQLLGLSDDEDQEEEECVKRGSCGNSCECEGGFYDKIVGVKGPKCKKEAERLQGWIKHFCDDGGERREPLRLAHLLLGKAVFNSKDQTGAFDFGGLEFPSTIVEFLENDKD